MWEDVLRLDELILFSVSFNESNPVEYYGPNKKKALFVMIGNINVLNINELPAIGGAVLCSASGSTPSKK